jgi:hypothetical protein
VQAAFQAASRYAANFWDFAVRPLNGGFPEFRHLRVSAWWDMLSACPVSSCGACSADPPISVARKKRKQGTVGSSTCRSPALRFTGNLGEELIHNLLPVTEIGPLDAVERLCKVEKLTLRRTA